MPVYEHSNIDFGKTQTHFSAIQAILRLKIIRISKIGAPAFFLPDKYGKMRFTTRRERRSMEENSRMKRKAAVMLLLMDTGSSQCERMWKKQYNKQQFRIKRKQHKRFLSIRCVERRQHIVRQHSF